MASSYKPLSYTMKGRVEVWTSAWCVIMRDVDGGNGGLVRACMMHMYYRYLFGVRYW